MPYTILIQEIHFPVVDQYKYLGIILDKKLLWTKHIQYVKQRCEKGLNLLRAVTKTKWGADTCTSLTFYRSYIRSVIDYGSTVYGMSSNTNLLVIDRIQYKAIRICLGVIKSSPCCALLAEAQEPPLKFRRRYMARKQMLKYRSFNTFLANKIANVCTQDLSNTSGKRDY
nr:unnamed protein product [Callosobruchus chinensis]